MIHNFKKGEGKQEEDSSTDLVILKILSRRRARRTLMPNEVPGLKKPHSTSKMLPTMTLREKESLTVSSIRIHRREQSGSEGSEVLTLQSKQLKEEWK